MLIFYGHAKLLVKIVCTRVLELYIWVLGKGVSYDNILFRIVFIGGLDKGWWWVWQIYR